MSVPEKTKDKIAKPVYFNITNEKEKEIVEWIDSKFSSFGGLVKDLLYKEMIKEKNGIQPIQFIEASNTINNDNDKISEISVEANEVESYEC